jgi:thiol:disulfide interchange protein DsbC
MRLFLTLLATVLVTTACNAGEAEIRKNIEARFPGAKVEAVSKTPVAGLYEVLVDGDQIVYADGKGDYVILGEMMQTEDKRNLTRERIDRINQIDLASLPTDQAIRLVKGAGKRRMAVFSDVDCPYCRKLEAEIAKLDDVTVDVYLYPLPFHADAPRKSRLVWCSPDRVKAWEDLMLRNKEPQNVSGDCANPIEANLALGQKLRIQGTPAVVFSNGKRAPGFIPADRIEQMLAEAAAK